MSTDRSRLVSSIRRIVLTDPDLSSALDAWQNKGDQASSTGVGTSDAERDRLCCDGSTSENPNPGADTRDTSEGGQDGLNPDDPALLDSGPGSLTGVTDCATGEPICFDGNDWLPPEGWDSPTTRPVDETFEEGKYWRVTDGTDTGRAATLQAAIDQTQARSDCIRCSDGMEWTAFRPSSPTGDATCTGLTVHLCSDEGFEGGLAYSVDHLECNGSEEDYCNPSDEDILVDSWPEDGCTNLAIKNGSIVGSKYDPENDGSYSKPMSEIELCDEFGNSFFLSPASTGLFKTIDATKTDGYLYDNNGKKIAHIDGNEYSDPDI